MENRAKTHNPGFFNIAIITLSILFWAFVSTNLTLAQNNDGVQNGSDENELKSKIEEKTTAIKQIEAEIEAYQKELENIGGQKESLQNEIKQLDVTRKKLIADISLTETKISRANLKMEQLTSEIGVKTDNLEVSRRALAESLRIINETEQLSMPEIFLTSGSLGQFADKINELAGFENGVQNHINELKETKKVLEDDRLDTIQIRKELVTLKNQLAGQQRVVEYNKSQTNKLLSETKNSESNYKKLLDERVAKRDAFERELLDYESQLKLLTDPSSIPEPQHGLLGWPVTNVKITQLFGNTEFAKSHSYVYNGQGHNGVDFGAPTGTNIKAAATGTVVGTGDTDVVCPNASYGKWILIEHNFGLSTLYAHLSVINVNEGDAVNAGETIGFSGNTGYSTGPHLHFTVYATQGVVIADRKSKVCLGTYRMPLADLRAYLNPLLYLPDLP